MHGLHQAVEVIAREIGLDRYEIAQRKAFLGFTETDIALLQQVHPQLLQNSHGFADAFYKHLLAFPALRSVLSDERTIARLKQAQADYFESLSAGAYGADYIANRLHIGLMHQRIGLEPKWYIGAYLQYLSDVMHTLWTSLRGDPEKFLQTYSALLKVVMLDIGLALDTYFQVERQNLLKHKRFAEQIVTNMPAGLMVVDADFNVLSINHAMRAMLGLGSAAGAQALSLPELVRNLPLMESIRAMLAAGNQQRQTVATVCGGDAMRHLEFNISRTVLETENLLLIAHDVTERVCAEEELRQFRLGMDNSADAIYLIDRAQMRIIDANETAVRTLGYGRAELLALGPQDLRFGVGKGGPEPVMQHYDAVIRSSGKSGLIEAVHRRKDGSQFPVEVYLRVVQSEGRTILIAVVRDITPRLQARAALSESEERFRLTFSQVGVGLAHVTPEGRWLRVNRKLCDIAGYCEGELLQMRFQEHTHPDDLACDLEFIRRMVDKKIPGYSREKRYIRKDGVQIWVNITVSPVWDAAGGPKYFISVIEDISRRKLVEEELRHLANHDALTALPNRALLMDRLAQAIAYANRTLKHVAVMFIDIDRFKNINDSLGHDVGDQILVEISDRLSSNIRAADTVARLGGDEFVLVLAGVAKEEDVAMVAQKVLASIFQPMTLHDHELCYSASIGISLYPKDGCDSQTLLQNADAAMYRAKGEGGNNFKFYAQEMNARTLERLKLEGRLRRALDAQEFVLHYQPQIDSASGDIVGVEALLRWQPAGKPMVSPADFIPIAEETGLILPLGEWVLRTACAQSRAWQDAGLPTVNMAVNLSARQFRQKGIVQLVAQVLRETGCRADCLELEITEGVIMENSAAAIDTLQQLSDMGVHLSIDDFGTGYSSLSYLKRFPIDTLKIDQSFVRDITTDADDAAIVHAVIVLAHSMRLKVIAEGVETAEQIAFLLQQKCDQMQGYYFSRPVAAEQIENLLARGKMMPVRSAPDCA